MNPLTISFSSKKTAPTFKGPPAKFASVLAHEIRNPLTNINLSVGVLESEMKDEELKIYLGIIMRSSVRINDLINELLVYQQAEEAPAEKYSIHKLLDEVLEMTQDRIMLKNIEVIKNYSAQDNEIILNRAKMKIALTNIIINAIDAMVFKKGELKLTTKSYKGKNCIQIKDNGCGISKENLKNIFKPYYTDKPGGLGLGLSTTFDFLHSNNVKINVESEKGVGTVFSLYLEKKILPDESKYLSELDNFNVFQTEKIS